MQGDYGKMVTSLAKPGEDILTTLTADRAHLTHMAMGVCGEAGELVDAIKRLTIYNKELDLDNVIEELGDLEFYMEGIRQSLGITRTTTLVTNMDKLLKRRYKTGIYSDEQAINREDK